MNQHVNAAILSLGLLILGLCAYSLVLAVYCWKQGYEMGYRHCRDKIPPLVKGAKDAS